LPNFRAALRWSLDGGDHDTGLAIAGALNDYWPTRGNIGEGRAALKALLEASAKGPPTARYARGMAVAASLAAWHVDFAAASVLGAEALRLAEELGDPQLLMEAHVTSGWATVGPLPAVARDHFSRALELARDEKDDRSLRAALGGLSVALLNLGELDDAMAVSIEVAERNDQAGDAYAADTGGGRIVVFGANGEIKAQIGNSGNVPSQERLSEPAGVAALTDGSVVAADAPARVLRRYSRSGALLDTWSFGQASALDGPRLAAGRDGSVYATLPGSCTVVHFGADGKSRGRIGGCEQRDYLDQPVGLAVGSDGRLFVADLIRGAVKVFGKA